MRGSVTVHLAAPADQIRDHTITLSQFSRC
jgi:hypothetical protein